MKYFVFFLANIVGFILLRYFSIFTFVLYRLGPHAEYSVWDFVPTLILQLLLLTFFLFRKRWFWVALLTITVILVLFYGRHYGYIPNSIVPS